MNWKTYVATQNAKAFVLPPGWDSRDTIAEQLECSPEKVREHLQPGIASREIETRQFPVWDAALGRKVTVTAYRRVTSAAPAKPAMPGATPKSSRIWSADAIATARRMAQEGRTHREIGTAIGRTKGAVKRWFHTHP